MNCKYVCVCGCVCARCVYVETTANLLEFLHGVGLWANIDPLEEHFAPSSGVTK